MAIHDRTPALRTVQSVVAARTAPALKTRAFHGKNVDASCLYGNYGSVLFIWMRDFDPRLVAFHCLMQNSEGHLTHLEIRGLSLTSTALRFGSHTPTVPGGGNEVAETPSALRSIHEVLFWLR